MPQIPKVGEIWTNTITKADGIVAYVEVDPLNTLVTFVSLTGMQSVMDFHRNYVPWEFKRENIKDTIRDNGETPESWLFSPESPHYLLCSSQGCRNPALVYYQRPLKGLEVACPIHIPKGVQSSLIDSTFIEELPYFNIHSFQSQKCKQCSRDATEVIGEVPYGMWDNQGTLWNCQKCGTWWVYIKVSDQTFSNLGGREGQILNLLDVVINFDLPEYNFISEDHYRDPNMAVTHINLYVKPKLSARIKGPQPLTYFDYVRADDLDIK